MSAIIILILLYKVWYSKMTNFEKIKFCSEMVCDQNSKVRVCGIRTEGEGFRLRLFVNECELMNYGCAVDESKAYGIININYCETSVGTDTNEKERDVNTENIATVLPCDVGICPATVATVCGLRQDGRGFRIRIFPNECERLKYNCESGFNFVTTGLDACKGMSILQSDKGKDTNNSVNIKNDTEVVLKNLVVVDATNLFKKHNNNINESIEDFFEATHVFDLPIEDVRRDLNETSRRMLLKVAGPTMVFKPWITIPKNISDDYYHKPTLSSCYHKCPTKCPDTYAPVCGVPGIVAREPSLMFQNHCFMDIAQCKMQWEDKSNTALSSFYIESSFLFCLGDEMNGLYRFLPLIRTLQHMGRLKKKGHFRYKFKNMRFFNNLLSREPNLMG